MLGILIEQDVKRCINGEISKVLRIGTYAIPMLFHKTTTLVLRMCLSSILSSMRNLHTHRKGIMGPCEAENQTHEDDPSSLLGPLDCQTMMLWG